MAIAVPGLVAGSICTLGAEPAVPRRGRPGGDHGHVVAVGNDAQFALLAEATEGAAFERADAVLLAIGTGIGSAVLSGGRILRGSHGAAASFGWACATWADPGNDRHGWLERHAAGPVLDAAGAAMTPPVDGRGLVAAAIAGDAGCTGNDRPCRNDSRHGTRWCRRPPRPWPGDHQWRTRRRRRHARSVAARRVASPTADPPARHRGRERRARAIGRVGRCSRGGAGAGANWWEVGG